MLWANSADNKLMIFFFLLFPENTVGFDVSCKLGDNICMNCQILFSGESKKNILRCRLKFLPNMQSVKETKATSCDSVLKVNVLYS